MLGVHDMLQGIVCKPAKAPCSGVQGLVTGVPQSELYLALTSAHTMWPLFHMRVLLQ